MTLSDAKQFGIEVLDLIDELVKPDIKYSFIEKFWHFFTGYAKKKILDKPDSEIIEKLDSWSRKKMLIIYSAVTATIVSFAGSIFLYILKKIITN